LSPATTFADNEKTTMKALSMKAKRRTLALGAAMALASDAVRHAELPRQRPGTTT